jgi:c-di-AMP phosphodiesterase-like protein
LIDGRLVFFDIGEIVDHHSFNFFFVLLILVKLLTITVLTFLLFLLILVKLLTITVLTFLLFYQQNKRKVKTVMVNNFTNINKTKEKLKL